MIPIQPLHFLDEEIGIPCQGCAVDHKAEAAPVVSFYKSSIK